MMAMMITVGLIVLFLLFHPFENWLIALIKENDFDTMVKNSDERMHIRIKKARLSLFMLTIWSVLDYSLTYLVFVLTVFFLMLKIDYWKLKRSFKKTAALLKFQFPIWLRQLQILLQSNTVAVSLQLTLPHAPMLIQEDLKELIIQIEEDALNITPYLNFLKGYRLSEIERAMKLLYRYNTVGKEDAYLQFNRMIQTTTKWLRSERMAHHDDSLAIYEWISMVPLAGVTVFFLAIMCDVIVNMLKSGL